MNPKKLLIWAAAFVLVFLLGYLPGVVRSHGLERQLEDSRRAQRLCEVKELAGMVFLETSMKNYGTALQHSTRLYEQVRALTTQPAVADLRGPLDGVLARRDQVTAGLARGDAEVYGPVQELYRTLLALR